MKNLTTIAIALLASTSAIAAGSHAVRGYVTSDGDYVEPHYQTNPNSTKVDNWSSTPNVNPYTGKAGTIDPYAPTAPRSPYSPAPKSNCYNPKC